MGVEVGFLPLGVESSVSGGRKGVERGSCCGRDGRRVVTVRRMSSEVRDEVDTEAWRSFFPKSQDDILYMDDEIVAFDDIWPRAHQHILIVPKRHLVGVESLDARHAPMCKC